jgi:hypothetical protein
LTLPYFWKPAWQLRMWFVPIQPAEEVGGLAVFLYEAELSTLFKYYIYAMQKMTSWPG